MILMNDRQLKLKILHILLPFLRCFYSVIYDKKYLKGKYFDSSHTGWQWAWRSLIWQKGFGYNREVPWPVSPFMTVYNCQNIIFDPDDLHNFQENGSVFSAAAKIMIGKGTFIGPNVGLITHKRVVENPSELGEPKEIIIGKHCWIGMNSVILPGIILGDHTVVGAGAIVTKSFPEGYVVIGGNPANVIRTIDSP
jgi:hypothetical protein